LKLSYDSRLVSADLDVTIPRGRITVIVGPNACGKSTLLRALSRLLAPRSGQIVLEGKDIRHYRARELACKLGLLPQSSVGPAGICVAELVARGRYPHQTLFRQWSTADEAAVWQAMADTRVTELADRVVDELSGGQRQRVWLAMALAQDTPVMLLDEPTTFLDIAHQIEVLDLCADLHESGRTMVAVLHDLNQACRYATHLIVMRDGRVLAEGHPADVVTPELVRQVFELRCEIIQDPQSG